MAWRRTFVGTPWLADATRAGGALSRRGLALCRAPLQPLFRCPTAAISGGGGHLKVTRRSK